MREQVTQFMETYKQLPSPLGFIALLDLRFRLIDEEVQELHEATDPVNVLDALVDILYVSYGALIAFGEESEEYDDLSTEYDEALLFKSRLDVNTDDLVTAVTFEEVVDAINDIIYRTAKLGSMFDLKAAFNEVHRSNMSKLDSAGNAIFNQYGKVLKGPNYSKPDLGQFIPKETDETRTDD